MTQGDPCHDPKLRSRQLDYGSQVITRDKAQISSKITRKITFSKEEKKKPNYFHKRKQGNKTKD